MTTKTKPNASKNGAKPKRERKPRQPYLSPDMAPPSFPDLDAAAEEYVEHRDARQAALKLEIAAHDKLLALMKDKKVTEYAFDQFNVILASKEKVRVRRKKEETSGSNEDE